jgi:hypothetical protein
MSDDAPRSTHGNRPDQRRGRGAPPWWDALQRTDLPDDPLGKDTVVDTAGWEPTEGFPGARRPRRSRLAMIAPLPTALVVAIAVAVAVWVASAAAGRGPAGTAAVIVAVPVALLMASVAANLAGRRHRH